jgi:thiosulfate/3-mercaptopyruvate sulfurtransferase
VDCRFSLANPEQGKNAYQHGHIPNARYAHLDNDLSSQITDFTGRHPLPDFRVLAEKLGAWGITNQTQVIVYDDASGVFAGRLWWLLRHWFGHDKVAVLDGGIQAWQKKFDLVTTLPKIKSTTFRPYLNDTQWLTALQVQNATAQKKICLIDARTPERYRGEVEPIDFVAGHIPPALNRPFQLNLDKAGFFLPIENLLSDFKTLISDTKPENMVHYCGSGVTACHNLLAMEYIGLKGSKLYAGSWSEWIRNQNRPIGKG